MSGQVVIEVEGGLVTSVYATDPSLEVRVIDWDSLKGDGFDPVYAREHLHWLVNLPAELDQWPDEDLPIALEEAHADLEDAPYCLF